MQKHSRLFRPIIILIFIVFPISLAVVSLFFLSPSQDTPAPSPIVNLASIYIPEQLKDSIGLYWLKDDFSFVKSEQSDSIYGFDKSQPTQIYFSCQVNDFMQDDTLLSTLKIWKNKGYNVAIFDFQSLAFDETTSQKIWGLIGKISWINQLRQVEKHDTPSVSIAEIFCAYYLDFMPDDYISHEVRFSGSGYGGELMYAVSSYLLTMIKNSNISPHVIPQRLTYLSVQDWQENKDFLQVSWLDSHVKDIFVDNYSKNSNVIPMQIMGDILADAGLAIEIIYDKYPTSDGIKDYSLYKHGQFLEYRIDWQSTPHTLLSWQWYSMSLNYAPTPDYAMNNNQDTAFSAQHATSYVKAKQGIIYNMEKNYSLSYEDDIIFSTNIQHAIVAGFCFFDINENGIYDESITHRVEHIKVELYVESGIENRLLGAYITNNGGYYSIKVPSIYANSFDKLYIKVFVKEDTIVTGRADKLYMLNNDINPNNNKSDMFTLQHNKATKIINIGLHKG